MTTIATDAITRDAVERLSARGNEPEWLLKRRLEAWRLFEEAPMPDPLSEEWKHTDATRLSLDGLLPFAPAPVGPYTERGPLRGVLRGVGRGVS